MSDETTKALNAYRAKVFAGDENAKLTREYNSYGSADLQTVTDFENDEEVQQDYDTVITAMARNKTATSAIFDTAAYSDDGPSELLRDLTLRIGTKVNLATEASDWTSGEKEAFNRMQNKWNDVSVTGMAEWAGAIKDYGIDAVANFETIPAIASLIFQGGTGAAAAQVASRTALSKTLAKVSAAAATGPTTKTGFAAYGAAFGGADDISLQNLELGTGARESYDSGQTITGAAFGAVAGAGLKKGIELFAGRNASKLAKEAAKKDLETPLVNDVPESQGLEVLEEGIASGTVPKVANEILVDLSKLADTSPESVAKLLADETNVIRIKLDKLVDEAGGGAVAKEEVTESVMQAFAGGGTTAQINNKLAHGMWKTTTSLVGKLYGKAPGILTPYAKFSSSAKELQKKLNYQFAIGYKTTGELVQKDFSETATRITGSLNVKFLDDIEPIAMHSLSGEIEDGVNKLLNLAVRGQASGDKKIDLAAKKIQTAFKNIGRELKKEGLIDHEVENYIPRMWDRKAIEQNQDELAELLFKEGEAGSKAEAKNIVKGMLEKENQLSSGTSGHFFSAKRVFDKIDNEANLSKFLNQDLRASVFSYNFQAGKSLAKKKVLGVKNEEQFVNTWVNRIDSEMKEAGKALSLSEKSDIRDLYRVATGENLARYSDTVQNVADAYTLTTRVALLGLTTVSSLTEIMINLSKGGVRNTIKGFQEASEQSFKNVTKDLHSELQSRHGLTAKEAYRETDSVGLAMDQARSQLGNRIAGDDLMNEAMQKANNKFFRITLLDQWTKFVQRTSFATGKGFIDDNLQALAKHGDLSDTKKTATLIGELNELGVDYKQGIAWIKNGSKTDDAFYQEIIDGAARYTNQIILQPTGMAGLKPLLHSKPTTSILFQLMGYPAAFSNTVLKGAAQKVIQDPTRNAGKLAVTGILMTETARMTNWFRSRGESEKDKSTTEIYTAAAARVGLLGLGADQLMRGQKTTKYTGSAGAGIISAPFGPVVGDVVNTVLRGPAQMLGGKVPFSAMGNAVVGKDAMREYRKKLREMDKDLLNVIAPPAPYKSTLFSKGGVVDVPNAPAEPDERINKITKQPYNLDAGSAFMDAEDPMKRLRQGFVLGGVTKVATKGLSKLAQIIDDKTDNMFKPEISQAVADDIDYNVMQPMMRSDDPDMPSMYDEDDIFFIEELIESTVKTRLGEKVSKTVDELNEEFPSFKENQGGEEFSKARGYTDEQFEDYLKSNELSDEYDLDGTLTAYINESLTDLKTNHTLVHGENLDPIDENAAEGLGSVVDYFSSIIKSQPVGENLTPRGLRKAARFQISKLLKESKSLNSIEDLIDSLPTTPTLNVKNQALGQDTVQEMLSNTVSKTELLETVKKQGNLQPKSINEFKALQAEASTVREAIEKIDLEQFTYIQKSLDSENFPAVSKGITNLFKIEVEKAKLTKKVQKWFKQHDFNAGLARFAEGGAVYNIESGDTLSGIARKYGTTVDQLAADNKIEDVNLIYAGKSIKVPKLGQVDAPTPVETPVEAPVEVAVPEVEEEARDFIGEAAEVAESATETIESVVDETGQAISEGAETVRDFIGESANAVSDSVSSVGESIDTASDFVSDTASKTLNALKKISFGTTGSQGRTASNTVGTTGDSEITMPEINFAELGKGNTTPEPDLSEVPDVLGGLQSFLSNGRGRTADNTVGATAEPRLPVSTLDPESIREIVSTPTPDLSTFPDIAGGFKSILDRTTDTLRKSIDEPSMELPDMPDIDSEGIREAVASPVVDLTSPPEKPEKGLPINLQRLISSPLQQALSLAEVNIDPLVLLADQAKLSIAERVFGKDSYIARSQSDDITEKDLSSQVVEAMRTQAIDMFKTGGRGINDSSLLGKGKKRSDVLDYRKAASFFTNPTKSISLITGETSKGAFTLDKDNNLILNDVYDFPDYNEGLTKKGSSPIYMTVHNMFEPRGNTGDEGFLSGLFAVSAENTRNMRINLGPAPQELIAALSKEGKLIASR